MRGGGGERALLSSRKTEKSAGGGRIKERAGVKVPLIPIPGAEGAAVMEQNVAFALLLTHRRFIAQKGGKRKMTPVCDIFTDILKSGWKKSDLRSARYAGHFTVHLLL